MSLPQAIGKFCAGNWSLESAVVWLGHQTLSSLIVRSPCDRTGEQISIKDPTAVRAPFTRFGAYVSVRLDEPVPRQIYFHGEFEPQITDILKRLVQPGQIWLEVGASVGLFTMLLSKGAGDTGHVHVFEPKAAMAERIRASIVLNGATHVHLGNPSVSNVSGQGLMSLDDYLERVEAKPDFMKVCSDGFAVDAFRGMERTMRKHPPKLILAELSQMPGSSATTREIITYLAGFDYLACKIGERGVELHGTGTPIHPPENNFVFIQKNVADELLRVLKK